MDDEPKSIPRVTVRDARHCFAMRTNVNIRRDAFGGQPRGRANSD